VGLIRLSRVRYLTFSFLLGGELLSRDQTIRTNIIAVEQLCQRRKSRIDQKTKYKEIKVKQVEHKSLARCRDQYIFFRVRQLLSVK